jgi:Tol biopolymer transport system component
MRIKFLLTATLVFAITSASFAQNNSAIWLRYPSISPDGKTIVFEYKGDLYKVPSTADQHCH